MSERLYDYMKITDLKDMLKKSGEKYANKIAYKLRIDKNKYRTITHKQVREMVDALGTALIDMKLKNKRIAVIGENRYEWEIAYLSIVCGTGIVVPLDKSLPEPELAALIERSEVEAIFYSKKYEDTLKRIKLTGKSNLKHLISMDSVEHSDGIYSEQELIEQGKKLIKQGNTEFINAKIDNESMNIMLFTSGTTSASKIVALSHKNICTNLMDLSSVLDVNQDDIFLSFLPLHHVFECTVGFLFALYIGAQTVFCDGIRHIVENMYEYKVSVMASVPAIYEGIYRIIRKQLDKQGKADLIRENKKLYAESTMEERKKIFKDIHDMLGGNVRLMISGAASLDSEIENKFRLLGLNLVQAYGLTETSPVVAIGNKKYYRVGSIGKTVPSVEARIDNCDKDGVGELVVKGPSIMLEYYGNKKATRDAIVDNWFYTGDLAKIDEDGYIFIRGRKKSVIVLKNGKNIFPEEMENLVNKIEGVEESFIFGKQMSEDVNDIKIFVKIVYNEQTAENVYKVKGEENIYKKLCEQIKEVNQSMPKYKAIRGVIISTKPLIKTATNKIKREKNLEQIMKESSKK